MTGSYWEMATNAIKENQEIVKQNRADAKANGTDLVSRIKNSRMFSYHDNYDDKIEIKEDTRTLLGDDFSVLYESSEVTPLDAGNGATVNVLKSNCSYPTEMHSGNLVAGDWSEYSTVPVDKRACYEVALLTKKYAALPESDENATAYASQMALYRQFCESNGIDWNAVIYNVSGELQTEVADYKDLANNKSDLYAQVSKAADLSRAQAADAHNMLLTCAPEGYIDSLLPSLSGRVSYEDTTDTTYDDSYKAKGVGFLAVVHSAFVAIYEHLPHPIEWMKTVFGNFKREGEDIVENTKGLVDEWDAQSDARIAEGQEVLEQLNGAKVDLSNTGAGQAVSNANNTIQNEVQEIWADPSQEIQDARDWLGEKADQAKPYIDAAGNALNAAGEKIQQRTDEFVERWATPETVAPENAPESSEEITTP